MAYCAYCAIISILCLLCHNKPTVCHTMSTRVPCFAYKCHTKLSYTYCGTLCLLILCLLFHNKPPVCHTLPTKMSCYLYYKILSCSSYCGILCQLCHNKPTICQRWSSRERPWPRGRPREHIFKSLALASNPSSPQKYPVLGSRIALFFE